MKFKDLSGREHTFELDMSFKLKDEESCRSGAQFRLGALLAKIYGRNNIFEDYPLPSCGNLSWDFWIPKHKLAFEFHGRQHFQFVKFFHETKAGFVKQVNADVKKAEIAAMNDVTLIVLQESDFKDWSAEELMGLIEKRI